MGNNSQLQFNGVMLNAYPDSIGNKLTDTLNLLQTDVFKDVFSFFYILPTFFNSDLDRGFSIIDYNLNNELVTSTDLETLKELNIKLKFDIVLNHLSVASPQFKDLLKNGHTSQYKDFFINWNSFWKGYGTKNDEGIIIPKEIYLDKLFMRKEGLPILKLKFPDGSIEPYWNTFYQAIKYEKVEVNDFHNLKTFTTKTAEEICNKINQAIDENKNVSTIDFENHAELSTEIFNILENKKIYLGQMDVNANSEKVWEFYEETLAKLSIYGCKVLRLDAFAYLHKEVGESNFFNKPGTWDYLKRIKNIADKHKLILLPEIHAEYGSNLHDEVAKEGYMIYDFFLPGLIIHTLEKHSKKALVNWISEIQENGYKTVNMLGCHDGIPVLDLKGKEIDGNYHSGLLSDIEIEDIMTIIIERGGRVKNLYGPSGKKISYYQINATYFSALGEDEKKLLLARAIQLFMPGIPQIWYLDLFAGKNNNEAADKAGTGGHKEINRTNLTLKEVGESLKLEVVKRQLELIKLRNTCLAFGGELFVNNETDDSVIELKWKKGGEIAQLQANLKDYSFRVTFSDNGKEVSKKYK